jgi:hypothetical protein
MKLSSEAKQKLTRGMDLTIKSLFLFALILWLIVMAASVYGVTRHLCSPKICLENLLGGSATAVACYAIWRSPRKRTPKS